MKILAIDIGSINSGYALLDDGYLIDCGEKLFDRNKSFNERLADFYYWIMSFYYEYDDFKPDLIVCEEPVVLRSVRSSFKVAQLQACIIVHAVKRGSEFRRYYPTTIKKAITGSGKASKEDVAKVMIERYGLDEEMLTFLDATDALAIASHAWIDYSENNAN